MPLHPSNIPDQSLVTWKQLVYLLGLIAAQLHFYGDWGVGMLPPASCPEICSWGFVSESGDGSILLSPNTSHAHVPGTRAPRHAQQVSRARQRCWTLLAMAGHRCFWRAAHGDFQLSSSVRAVNLSLRIVHHQGRPSLPCTLNLG